MLARSASTAPSGVANALRQSANGSRIGACEVPSRTKVSADSAAAQNGARRTRDRSRRRPATGRCAARRARPSPPPRRRGRASRSPGPGSVSVDVPAELGPVPVVGTTRVGRRPHGRLRELLLHAGSSRAEGRALEEQRAFELLRHAHDNLHRHLRADLRRRLARDVLARPPPREARHDGHEHRRDRRIRVGHPLRVPQHQDSTVLPVGHDDRLDRAQRGAQ